MPILGSLFGSSEGEATIDAGRKNLDVVTNLRKSSNALTNKFAGRGRGYLKDGLETYEPYAQFGQDSTNLYGDALGLNGAEGNQNAQDAFQQGPGYQFQMDQGLQALERRAGAQGRLQSGETGLDTLRFATGLADQEYGGWLDRLQGGSGVGLAAAGGQTNQYNNLAGLEQNTLNTKLGINSGAASGTLAAYNQIAGGIETNKAATRFNDQDLENVLGFAGYGSGFDH